MKTTKAKAKVSCTGSCSPYANATATVQTDANGNVSRRATAVTSSTCTNCSSVSSSSISSGAADNDSSAWRSAPEETGATAENTGDAVTSS